MNSITPENSNRTQLQIECTPGHCCNRNDIFTGFLGIADYKRISAVCY